MDYISQIEIQSGLYKIKDSEARETIAENKNTVDQELETINNTISTNNSAINKRIDSIVQKDIIIISDSYGEGYTASGMTTSFITLLNNYFQDSNITIHSSAHGGDGFATNGFFNQLVNFATSLSSDVKNKISEIYVIGGYNDSNYSPDQIKGGISSFLTYMKTNFPNAILYTGFVGLSFKLSDLTQKQNDLYYANVAYTTYYDEKYQSIINACGCLSGDYMANNDYHPNQLGQNAIFKMMKEYIVTHSYNAYNMLTNYLTVASNINENNTPFLLNMKNGINTFTNILANFSFKSPITIDAGNTITLGTFTTIVGGPVGFSCVAFATGASVPIVGELRIRKTVLQFYVFSGHTENVTGLNFSSVMCMTAPQLLFY